MDTGSLHLRVDIPPDFQRDRAGRPSPAIQLNVDATAMTRPSSARGYIQKIVADEVAELRRGASQRPPSPVALVVRVRVQPERRLRLVHVRRGDDQQITMLAMVLTGAALIREREHGTIEHLLVMPVTPSRSCWQGLVEGAGRARRGLRCRSWFVVQGCWGPDPGSILCSCGAALYLFAVTSLGIFLATIARSMPQFGLLIDPGAPAAAMLSGRRRRRWRACPSWLQQIMLVSPTTHFVVLSQAILYRGAGLEVVWPQFLALAVIGMLVLVAALLRFRATTAQAVT